jgi:hypothetical protein
MRFWLLIIMGLLVLFSACGFHQPVDVPSLEPPNIYNPFALETITKEAFPDQETTAAIPTFIPLPGPCETPGPDQFQNFINRSITANESGKTIILHVTSRFWIYLDDRKYPLRELLISIPNELIGYISNGSIRGPQCYPIMFEAVKEGRGQIQLYDFKLNIIVNNILPESPIPLN